MVIINVCEKIKNNEILWVTHEQNKIPKFCITSNKDRTKYYLYQICGNNYKKIKTSQEPDFDDYIIYDNE